MEALYQSVSLCTVHFLHQEYFDFYITKRPLPASVWSMLGMNPVRFPRRDEVSCLRSFGASDLRVLVVVKLWYSPGQITPADEKSRLLFSTKTVSHSENRPDRVS